MTLYNSACPNDWEDDNAPRNETDVKISVSSFDCAWDYCSLTCSPFEVVAQRMYEFVGTLKVGENSEILLENIELDQSSQLVDGNWKHISAADFDVMFP